MFDSAWGCYRQTLYNIAEGVRANDPACVELAIRYIELRFIGSYSGYLRSLLATRLKHATLTPPQRRRLSAHFLHLLTTGDRCDEFRDYIRLWAVVISPEELEGLVRLADACEGDAAAFVKRVRARLSEGLVRRAAIAG